MDNVDELGTDWLEIGEATLRYLQEEREKALKYLGTNWVLHPKYKHEPQRLFLLDRWKTEKFTKQLRKVYSLGY